MEKLAVNLRFLREKFNLSQADMKARLDIGRTTWLGYEKGTSNPVLRELVRIAEYFGVSETDLLHSDLSKNPKLIHRSVNDLQEDQGKYALKKKRPGTATEQTNYKTIIDKLAGLEKKIEQLKRKGKS